MVREWCYLRQQVTRLTLLDTPSRKETISRQAQGTKGAKYNKHGQIKLRGRGKAGMGWMMGLQNRGGEQVQKVSRTRIDLFDKDKRLNNVH